jgi:hypothetical protein
MGGAHALVLALMQCLDPHPRRLSQLGPHSYASHAPPPAPPQGMRPGEGDKLLAVEDPLDDANDVARSSFAWRTVRSVFDHAYQSLTAPCGDDESLLGRIIHLKPVIAGRGLPQGWLVEPPAGRRSGSGGRRRSSGGGGGQAALGHGGGGSGGGSGGQQQHGKRRRDGGDEERGAAKHARRDSYGSGGGGGGGGGSRPNQPRRHSAGTGSRQQSHHHPKRKSSHTRFDSD